MAKPDRDQYREECGPANRGECVTCVKAYRGMCSVWRRPEKAVCRDAQGRVAEDGLCIAYLRDRARELK